MLAGKLQKVVLIGAGNMASHLGSALAGRGVDVVQVYNRSGEPGARLAARLGADFIPDPRELTRSADLYIVAVSDSAIKTVAGLLNCNDKLVVHTSGSVGMDELAGVSSKTGVFYPLQTFSPLRITDFREVPVCIEASDEDSGRRLEELALLLTETVRFVDSGQRRLLHLAAVFASNFTNYMYTLAEDLVVSCGMPPDLLMPLIAQTAENVGHGGVFSHQTGPAVREDSVVLEKHRSLLAGNPENLALYNLITDQIIQYKKSHGKL
jgi:predicted short-subunit dehydrogenase-like oxidoreductase (DUF2520 family)